MERAHRVAVAALPTVPRILHRPVMGRNSSPCYFRADCVFSGKCPVNLLVESAFVMNLDLMQLSTEALLQVI